MPTCTGAPSALQPVCRTHTVRAHGVAPGTCSSSRQSAHSNNACSSYLCSSYLCSFCFISCTVLVLLQRCSECVCTQLCVIRFRYTGCACTGCAVPGVLCCKLRLNPPRALMLLRRLHPRIKSCTHCCAITEFCRRAALAASISSTRFCNSWFRPSTSTRP